MAERTFDGVNINITLKPQETRANLLSTSEDLAVQMGKIQKWYQDLRPEAWNGTSRDNLLVRTKTFTGFIGKTQFYFGSVRQTDWNTPMLLRYRIKVWVDSNSNYCSYADVLLTVLAGASAYNTTQNVRSTSYRPVYYHYWQRVTTAGFNNGYGTAVGIGLNDSTNPETSSLARSCYVEILECVNCTFTFFDSITPAASLPGTGAEPSNYSSATGTFSGNGTYPDSNTYDRTYLNERPRAGTNGVKLYSLCAYNNEGKLESFTTSSGTGTSKAFYTAGKFLYKPCIYYYAGSGNISSGSVIGSSCLYPIMNSFDMRYSANVTTSTGFTAYTPLYLEIDFDSNGFWHPTTTGLTQTLVSGKYYMFIGIPVSVYQMPIDTFHPVFYYDGTKLIDADRKFAQDVVPSNNVTGTGESGKIAMFNGQHTITTGTVTTGTINSTTCDISDGVLSFTLTPNTAVTDISLDLSNN